MIEKIAVRRMLNSYEKELLEEIVKIEEEMQRMTDACATMEMKTIWFSSKKYMELSARKEVLHKVYFDIIDMRCGEALED